MFYCWVFFINILDSQTRLLEKNAKDRPLEPVGRSTSSEGKTVKLTTRGRFAVTSMIDLSLHSENGPACRGGAQCLAHGLWADLNAKMAEFLNAQSLQSIKEKSLKEHAHHGEVREQPIIVHITEPKS